MCCSSQAGDAKELLRCINPREAALIDPATAIHVRFRLGGSLFPPAIYYKVYTHGPVSRVPMPTQDVSCAGRADTPASSRQATRIMTRVLSQVTDVGAFAPRDYTATFQPPPIALHNHAGAGDGRAQMLAVAMQHDGWYRRAENNGWRPVAGETLGELDTTARTSRPIVWHHDKMVRKEHALRKRKERKRQWMREMYELGKRETAHGGGGGEEDDGLGSDDDVDALLECAHHYHRPPTLEAHSQLRTRMSHVRVGARRPLTIVAREPVAPRWSDGLDFESYQADWMGLATSARPDWASSQTASRIPPPLAPLQPTL